MNLFKVLFSIVIALFIFTSCEDTKEDFIQGDKGYSYFPLEINNYWIYQVDSIIYRNLENKIDTTRSFLKEEIVEVFVDQVNDTIFTIERSFSESQDYNWKIKDVWTASKNSTSAYKTEENLKFIKMVFPIKKNRSWDGNIFIDEESVINVAGDDIKPFLYWDYRVLDVLEKDTVFNVEYSDVAVIQNADSDELVSRRYVVDKYAKNIGLIHKLQWILDTSCIAECDTLSWLEKAEKGFVMEYNLVEYGN